MKKLFHHDHPIAGIDIGQTGIKVMAIDHKKWQVIGYGSIDLDPIKLQDSITKGDEYLAEGIHMLLTTKVSGKIPSNQVVVSVPTSRTYSRTMSLPLESESNLAEAIQLEAEQYIPIPVSELNLDFQIIDKTESGLIVLISAVPKKIVETTVLACEQVGLEVVMVEPGISAIARLITETEEGQLPTVIVDIGAAYTDIAILDKSIRVTGGADVGGNSFTLEISKKLKVSLENAHQLKVLDGMNTGPKQTKIRSAMKPSLEQIISEVNKMIRYYNERLGSKQKIEQLILVGNGSNVPGLGDYFTESLMMPARVASPWQALKFGKLTHPSRQYKPRYITAAGLACVPPKEIWS